MRTPFIKSYFIVTQMIDHSMIKGSSVKEDEAKKSPHLNEDKVRSVFLDHL
jgi:hypothetical protein